MRNRPFQIANQWVEPDTSVIIRVPVAKLYDHTELEIPLRVFRAKKTGPTLFVCAAVHGDEINGVEIIRRVSERVGSQLRSGTLICIPIVNVFGFNSKSRYLPDRRDLNRSFPGKMSGSLASRIAHVLMNEVVKKADYGIDLHSASSHRKNFPQIRCELSDPKSKRLAVAFGTEVVLNSSFRDGSLRQAANQEGVPTLVYEGGESLRFDEPAIREGVRGVLSVMAALKMITAKFREPRSITPVLYRGSRWIRAPHSGILRRSVKLGQKVRPNDLLGEISDPLGETAFPIFSPSGGMIISDLRIPLVNRGDAIFHIATERANVDDDQAPLDFSVDL